MWKVFLSSTSRDLSAHREAVLRAIRKLDHFHCRAMEDFGARPLSAVEFCRSAVQGCDVFVGIVGRFHGSCPENSSLSFTEHEYETALSIGLPVLLFLAPDDMPWPAGLTQSPEAEHRQRQFRERVQAACIRDFFFNPDGLAAAVTAALVNFALGRKEGPAVEPARRQDRGVLVPKLCDRAQQEEQFNRFLSHHTQTGAERPLAVLIRGWERERLDSLVARFCGTSLRKLAERQGGVQQGALDVRPVIDWPVDGAAEARSRLLLERVFESYECAETPGEAGEAALAFLRLARARRYPVVAFQFHIQLRRWNAAARACLERFLTFWDEIGRCAQDGARPRFVLFIQLAYPEHRGWRRWLFRPRGIERQLLAVLNRRHSTAEQLNPCCPTLLLGELSPVHRDDVYNWFQRHRLFEDRAGHWKQRLDALFGKCDFLPMIEVESALEAFYEEHLRLPGATRS